MVHQVIVNVFELIDSINNSNKYLKWIGLGAYHTSVEICGREYSFSNDGIRAGVPSRKIKDTIYKEAIVMGEFEGNINQVNSIISHLRNQFHGHTYHIATNNCNHFSDALCKELIGKSLPSWINRAASYGSWFFSNKKIATKNLKKLNEFQEKNPINISKKKELTSKQKELLEKLKKQSTN